MARKLTKGSEAIAEAAIRNGARYFFGYPITPQTEIPEYLSARMFDPDVNGCFLQAESEIAAINMVYGAASTGVRVFTSSSSPGVSLMQEGLSTICGAELPCVLVDIMRAGPGVGSMYATQGDYNQAVKGGGHGDYQMIVFAPSTVQEAVDCLGSAFDLADKYRMPVMIFGDAMLAQMMEPVELPEMRDYCVDPDKKPWAATGFDPKNPVHERANVHSMFVEAEENDLLQNRLQSKYAAVRENEVVYESYNMDNAEIVITAFGTVARIAKSVVDELEEEGIHVGMLRPITLWPFPYDAIYAAATKPGVKAVLDIELNAGQMLDDVKVAIHGDQRIEFLGHCGFHTPTVEEIRAEILKIREG